METVSKGSGPQLTAAHTQSQTTELANPARAQFTARLLFLNETATGENLMLVSPVHNFINI